MQIRRTDLLSRITPVHGPPSQSFHKNESIFQAVFNATFQFIALLTPKGMLLKANQTALDIIKPANSDLTGQYFWDTPWWNSSLSNQRRIKHAISRASRNKFIRFEIEQMNPQGETRIFDFSFKPVVNTQGNIILIIAEGRDITLRKKLDQLRNEFLSAVAHELKTPITVLKLLAQSHVSRARKTGNDSISLTELEMMDNELSRLTILINDLLDSSKFEIGKIALEKEKFNLVNLVCTVVNEMKIYAPNHNFEFKSQSPDIEVHADQKRIKQVLINLLSNAVKYSNEATTISVSITKRNGFTIINVKDQGRGIPKSKLQAIFDKYYQVKTKSPDGVGLGLYISKEIVRRHKGKIWANSKRGRGSSFTFTLPL